MVRRKLGSNLENLFSEETLRKVEGAESTSFLGKDSLKEVSLKQIQPGKYQPRRNFSEESLKELAESIKTQGIIQPIVIRSVTKDQYEIIAGERRFRAAKLAGLETIPVIIKELPDEAVIAMALIENIQRENLNPIEEALALQRLIDEFEMTHEQVAKAIGKSRTAVSNTLRLLGLTSDVREFVEQGKLQMGHARALLSLPEAEQIATAQTIITKDLSVRETEDLIRRLQNLKNASHVRKPVDPIVSDLQRKLTEKFGVKVSVHPTENGKGKVSFKYKSLSDLTALLDKLE